jgi:hypothetical protein
VGFGRADGGGRRVARRGQLAARHFVERQIDDADVFFGLGATVDLVFDPVFGFDPVVARFAPQDVAAGVAEQQVFGGVSGFGGWARDRPARTSPVRSDVGTD